MEYSKSEMSRRITEAAQLALALRHGGNPQVAQIVEDIRNLAEDLLREQEEHEIGAYHVLSYDQGVFKLSAEYDSVRGAVPHGRASIAAGKDAMIVKVIATAEEIGKFP